MYRIKAFGAFPPISRNTANQVNVLGELSAYSMTFATDRGIFKDISKPNSLLYSFASFTEISAVETQAADVPPAVASLLLEIMETLYTQANQSAFGQDELPVQEYLLNTWTGLIQNVVVNTMVTDGQRWLPSSIYFEGTSQTNPYSAQLWFSDSAFRSEYDLYEIRVVSPIDNIDRFFDTAANVQAIVDNEITLAAIADKAGIVAGDAPYTQLVVEQFEWVDPANPAVKILVPWPVIIYGDAGRNVDSIRMALTAWIKQNTHYAEDQWMTLFPDIFGATEFIFVPFWSHYAIPDDAVNGGIYSPVNNVQAALTMSKAMIRGVGYTDDYVGNNLNIMGSIYKSLQVGVVGGYRNRNGVNQLADRWPDYIAVSTNSIDFNRLSSSTQNLVLTLNHMLQVAETMTATSSIPRGFMRLVRDGVLYLTCTYERTTLIVASRASLLERYASTQGAALNPV